MTTYFHRRIVISVAALVFGAVFAVSVSSAQDSDLKTPKDRASYSLGVKLAELFRGGEELLNIDIVILALLDVYEGRELAMDSATLASTFASLQRELTKAAAEKAESAGREYLAANAGKEGVTVLPSGLQYKVLKQGTGAKPKATDTVKTHYRGTLTDGTEFDSSYGRGQPAEFGVGQVIPGWTEALKLMREGAKWELYIPSKLAYGARGAPPLIKPHSALIFEIELLEIIEVTNKNFR